MALRVWSSKLPAMGRACKSSIVTSFVRRSRLFLVFAASCAARLALALTLAGACRLAASQLCGAAGPGGSLCPLILVIMRRLPLFGAGGAVSGTSSIRRRCGGSVCDVASVVISLRCSMVGRGACSARSCERRSLTVLEGPSVSLEELGREIWYCSGLNW